MLTVSHFLISLVVYFLLFHNSRWMFSLQLENSTAFWLKTSNFQGFDETVAQRHSCSHIHLLQHSFNIFNISVQMDMHPEVHRARHDNQSNIAFFGIVFYFAGFSLDHWKGFLYFIHIYLNISILLIKHLSSSSK